MTDLTLPGQRHGRPNGGAPLTGGPFSRRFVLACSLSGAGLCLLVLLGWAADARWLTAFGPGFIPMAPSAALVGLSMALALAVGGRSRNAQAWLAGLAAAAASFLLIHWIAGFPDVERWLVRAEPFRPGVPLGRMSPVTALGFLAVAAALLLRRLDRGGGRRLGNCTALGGWAAAALGFIVVAGYLNLAPLLYQGAIIPMALPAALTLLLLGSGTAASAGGDALLNRLFSGPSVRAQLLRTLMPYLAAVVLVEGAMDDFLESTLGVNPALVSFLLTLFFCGIGALIVLRASTRVDAAVERARTDLETSEKHYRSVTESASEGIITVDEGNVIRAWNRGAAEIFGYPEDEVLGRTLDVLIPGNLRALYGGKLGEIESGEQPRLMGRPFVTKGLRKDGSTFPMELSISTWRSQDHRYFTGIVRDVSELRAAERALRESERELRTAQRVAGLGSWTWAVDSDVTTLSEELLKIMGLPTDFPPRGLEDHAGLFARDSWARLQEAVGDAIERGSSYEVELELLRPDGQRRWLMSRGEAQRNGEGRVVLLRGTVLDVTARKAAEEALRRSEIHFKTLVENLPDVVVRYDREGRRLYVSPSGVSNWGRAEPEVLGKTWRELGAPAEVAHKWEEAIRAVFATGQEERFQFPLTTRKGARHFDARLVPEFTEAGEVESVLAISRDVSDQREIVRALESQFDFQQKLIDAIPIPLFYRSRVGTYLGCNAAMEEALGIRRSDLIGRGSINQLPLQGGEPGEDGFGEVGQPGEVESYEGQFLRSDGKRRDAVFTRAAFTDDMGKVAGYVGAIVDITERKQLETEKLNIQAREHRARLGETMGLLVQGLAHEVRNPLFAIEANVAALERRVQGVEDAGPFMTHIRAHVERLGTLMKDLMELGRRVDPEDFVPCDLGSVLRQAVGLTREVDGNAAGRIRLALPGGELAIMGEPRQLTRAFFHVFSNAVEFSSEGQPVDVFVAAEGTWVTVEVVDQGTGIPERLKNTLFEPFVTGRTGHLGLGLTLARHYLGAHGAGLTAQNSPSGKGTTVRVEIPLGVTGPPKAADRPEPVGKGDLPRPAPSGASPS